MQSGIILTALTVLLALSCASNTDEEGRLKGAPRGCQVCAACPYPCRIFFAAMMKEAGNNTVFSWSHMAVNEGVISGPNEPYLW